MPNWWPFKRRTACKVLWQQEDRLGDEFPLFAEVYRHYHREGDLASLLRPMKHEPLPWQWWRLEVPLAGTEADEANVWFDHHAHAGLWWARYEAKFTTKIVRGSKIVVGAYREDAADFGQRMDGLLESVMSRGGFVDPLVIMLREGDATPPASWSFSAYARVVGVDWRTDFGAEPARLIAWLEEQARRELGRTPDASRYESHTRARRARILRERR